MSFVALASLYQLLSSAVATWTDSENRQLIQQLISALEVKNATHQICYLPNSLNLVPTNNSALPESLVPMSVVATCRVMHELYNLPTGEYTGSGRWAVCTRPAKETHLHKVSRECVSRSHGQLVCSLVSPLIKLIAVVQ